MRWSADRAVGRTEDDRRRRLWPNPRAVRGLVDAGFDAVGVEPVQGFLEAAREFLESPDRALQGTCEALPFPDGSQRVVVIENVIGTSTHRRCRFARRIEDLAPGGVLYITTTNRYRFSLRGVNEEFRTPYFNWFLPR